MSMTMEDEINRWTVRSKFLLVMEIIQGKATIAEAMLELRARKKLQSLLGEGDK